MKKSIIILTDIYYPHPMAGGICAHQVAKGLLNIGYDVHVICLRRKNEAKEESFKNISVHRIRMPIVYKLRDYSERLHNPVLSRIVYNLAIIINRFFKLLYIKWYPLMSPLQIINYVRRARKIDSSYVLGEYFSVESSLAAAVLKKRYGKKMIIYNVDSLSNADSAVGLSHSYVRRKGLEWEKKLFDIADGIVVMKSHENHYQMSEFDQFRHKIRVADLPLLEWNDNPAIKKDRHKIMCVYTGSLSKNLRNPDYLLQVLPKLHPDIEMHFFSKGDCEDDIRKVSAVLENRIIRHGHVEKELLELYYNTADFLISIGNMQGEFLPSKTIEYIAHLKPIIHFQYQEKDASVSYLKKYGHALIVDVVNNDIETNIDLINQFIREYRKGSFVFNSEGIKDIFKENTPEYTANIIDKLLQESK